MDKVALAYSCEYTDRDHLENFILEKKISEYNHIFAQVSLGNESLDDIYKLKKLLKSLLPQSQLIGNFTNDEIGSEFDNSNKTIITFFLFEESNMMTNLLSQIARDNEKQLHLQTSLVSQYDRVTGLPNRYKIYDIVQQFIERSEKQDNHFAVAFFDLDRFKMINDSFGHFVGDQVILEISNRIKSLLSNEMILGKFDGDKFIIIFDKENDIQILRQSCRKIIDLLNTPFLYNGQEFFLTASFGVSIYPQDGQDVESLLKNADMALNQVKKLGGNGIKFFTSDMKKQIQEKFELENYLRRAIEKNELFLLYQPLMDLHTGKIIGSEALIRWKHPKLGIISPMKFIPIAEETGLIHDIGKWVLIESCKQNKEWIDAGYKELFVSVNVSAQQFQHPLFIEHVKEALSLSNLDPKHLHLELTESCMITNVDKSIEIMEVLQSHGVKVSIDDFGTGYSSLSYLRHLPINVLKIDRSFINNIHEKEVDYSIVRAIIMIGNGLSVKVVAEGVETSEQLRELKNMNCDMAQGYYIENPINPKQFFELIAKKNKEVKVNIPIN